MATLTIKDLTASKELDGKAMAAVAGGMGSELAALVLGYTSVATSFPVYNGAENVGIQSNSVGSFNFGAIDQSNSQGQYTEQLGNLLGGA